MFLTFLFFFLISPFLIFSKISKIPWIYNGYNSFPVLWFGASPEGYETNNTLKLASRHSIAGWGWQQNNSGILGSEELNLYKQSKVFYDYFHQNESFLYNITQSTFVYRSGYCASPFWNTSANIIYNSEYKDYFIQNDKGELCWQKPEPLYDNLDGGPIWNFSNPKAREYYLNNVIYEVLNNRPYINSIFFDLCDWIYCDFNWNSLTNCTQWNGLTDNEKYLIGMNALSVWKNATKILNNNDLIPIISIRSLVKQYNNYTQCVINENEWINTLNNTVWIRYNEYWPDYYGNKNDSLSFLNMLDEMNLDIPSIQIHNYGIKPNETINSYFIGTFLMAQFNYSYYSASNGWFDDNWSWHSSYNNIYGRPITDPVKVNETQYFRQFEYANVSVNTKTRKANIVFFNNEKL